MSTTSPNFHPEPIITVIDVTDKNAKDVGVELFEQDLIKLDDAPMCAQRIIFRLASLVLVYHSSNVRLRTCTNISPESIVYSVFGPYATGTVNGLPIRSGTILAAAPESEARLVVNNGWESVAFFIPRQEIMEHISIRQIDCGLKKHEAIQLLDIDPSKTERLFELGKRLIHKAVAQPDLFKNKSSEQTFAKLEIIETLLNTIFPTNALTLPKDEQSRKKQFAIVKATEQYILEHAGADLYVTDLCKAADVSERTLEYAFKEIIGLTPIAYIKKIRLHLLHQSLLHANPETTTVSDEAQRWGFWHFSELSKAYKNYFHELPSETLSDHPQDKN